MNKGIYITKRINEELPAELVTYMFSMIGDVKKVNLLIDYLQVFYLNPLQGGRLEILHTQRNSAYKRKAFYRARGDYRPSKKEVFVIIDDKAITMMFADEY